MLHDDLPPEQLSFFIIACKDWDASHGGSTIYRGEGQPLIFAPQGNSFAIVQARKNTRDFVKYIAHFAGKKNFVKIEGIIS